MKRGYITTEAIVLKKSDYSESDLIVTLLTRSHGKVAAIAKGAKRSKRRFVGGIDIITLVDALLYRNRAMELARVETVKPIDTYGEIKADIERLGYASYMVELTGEFAPMEEPNEALFDHLKGFLNMLKDADTMESVARFFEIRLLRLAGLMPHLEGCIACSKGAMDETLWFSLERGGLLCGRCSRGGGIELSVGTVKTLLMALRLSIDKLHVLATGELFKKEARKLLYECIKYHLGREPKCVRFIEMIKAM